MRGYDEPYGWWGWHRNPPVPLSIVQIIESKSLDARLAAVLWILIERRASFIVAAEPPLAGKSTTLTALLDFLPPGTDKVFLRGMAETFDFTDDAEAHKVYLLCNEISDHLPIYLWGEGVNRLFELLPKGYAMAATMHADSVEEVLGILKFVPKQQLAHLNLVIILKVMWASDRRIIRRVSSVHFLYGDKSGRGLKMVPIAAWDAASDSLIHSSVEVWDRLAHWAGLGSKEFGEELSLRESYLLGLIDGEIRTVPAVREAIVSYRSRGR